MFLEPGQPRCDRWQRHPTPKRQTNQRLGLIEVVLVASQSLPKRFKMVHIAQVTKLKSDRLGGPKTLHPAFLLSCPCRATLLSSGTAPCKRNDIGINGSTFDSVALTFMSHRIAEHFPHSFIICSTHQHAKNTSSHTYFAASLPTWPPAY